MRGKIAIYLPSLEGGGAERITIVLANALAKAGYSVDLIAANASGPNLGEVSPAVHVIDLGKRRVSASLPALVRYLRQTRPAVMLAGLGHANLIAIVARQLSGVPMRLVVTEHNSIRRGLDTLKGRGTKLMMRHLYPRADAIVCVSLGIMRELTQLLGLPAAKMCTIYNPLDVDGVRARAAERPLHPWFAVGQPPVIIGVGRLTAQKDFSTLLRAFTVVRAKREARLVILGEGEERAALASLANSLGVAADVEMPGFQNNPYGWMAASAVYVMSSAWEGLPGVLLEAMACGVSIVSTDCQTGPDEILEEGRWGRLVPVGDSDALASAIVSALDSAASVDCAIRVNAFRIENALKHYEQLLFPDTL